MKKPSVPTKSKNETPRFHFVMLMGSENAKRFVEEFDKMLIKIYQEKCK